MALVPVVVLLGWACAAYSNAPLASLDISLVLVAALAAHIAVNTLNEYEDFRSGLDALTQRTPFSGGSGALQAYPDKAHYALLSCITSITVLLGIGVYLWVSRGAAILPIGIAGLLIIIAYTRWLTRSPLLCLLAPGLGFGPLMVLGCYWVLTGEYAVLPLLASLPVLFLCSNLLLINQFPDQEADRLSGRRHLLIRYGSQTGIWVSGLLMAAAMAVVPLYVVSGQLPSSVLLSLLTAPLAWWVWIGLRKHHAHIQHLQPVMAANVLLTLLVPILLATGLLLAKS